MKTRIRSRSLFIACMLTVLSGTAAAQVAISHTKALAGNVTPGDAAGYPVQIKQAGHYRLSSDLVVPRHDVGILIQAANVTLDLNGYTIRSTNGCVVDPSSLQLDCPGPPTLSTAHGVVSQSASTVVRNGRIVGFPGHGIQAVGGEVLEDLRVYFNARYGLAMLHSDQPVRPSRISASHFFGNRIMGALVRTALIERSQFSDNGSRGLAIEGGTLVDSLFVRNALQVYTSAGLVTTMKGTTILPPPGAMPILGAANVHSLGGNFVGDALF